VDKLVPDIEEDFLEIGQSKGKFGGGKRKIYRHTQKKVREGSRIKFAFLAVVGNRNGYIGVGYGGSRKSNSARELAVKNAKLNLTRISRGCGSWECTCGQNHSVPFKTIGKEGSITVTLSPAPRGTGLVASNETKKILRLAGINDVWTRMDGETRTRVNMLKAVYNALRNINMHR
jgi:small subunit ribosomal protein S5